MMRMTFSAVLLKVFAAVFKTVVDSVWGSSSSLAAATLRGAPVYVNWLSGAGLLLSVLSAPLARVGVPPGLGSFSSPPVVSPSEPVVLPVLSAPSVGVPLPVVGVSPALVSLPPEPVVPSEPVVPLSEPEVPPSESLLSGSELPAPVFLPSVVSPVWFFSVDWFSFSSPLPSEESLPLVSPG